MIFEEFLAKMSRPARGALAYEGITDFEKLAALTEKELLAFHGVGPKSLPVVQAALNSVGLELAEKSAK